MRCEPSVARQHKSRLSEIHSGTSRDLIFLIALRVISAQARFAPQEVLFASLTLRAALHYVRYSAALRSYSGFVDIKNRAASDAPTVRGLVFLPESQLFPAQQFLQVTAMAEDHYQ